MASLVRQRLKLASVSPKLMKLYRGDQMTLDQLMGLHRLGRLRRPGRFVVQRSRVLNKLSGIHTEQPWVVS
jgi:hypothetical protein